MLSYQVGHEDWVHRLVFHPSGKFLISTGDDKTIKTWDLKTGRCTRTIGDAHTQFIQCMSWGRQPATAPTTDAKDDKNKAEPQSARPVNVLATGSWDKVGLCAKFRCKLMGLIRTEREDMVSMIIPLFSESTSRAEYAGCHKLRLFWNQALQFNHCSHHFFFNFTIVY